MVGFQTIFVFLDNKSHSRIKERNKLCSHSTPPPKKKKKNLKVLLICSIRKTDWPPVYCQPVSIKSIFSIDLLFGIAHIFVLFYNIKSKHIIFIPAQHTKNLTCTFHTSPFNFFSLLYACGVDFSLSFRIYDRLFFYV